MEGILIFIDSSRKMPVPMRQANRFRTFSRFAARISWSQIVPTWVRVEIGAIWDRILCRQLS